MHRRIPDKLKDQQAAQKEGRRWHAFYRGTRDHRDGKPESACPFPDGSDAATGWLAGFRYMEADA